MYFFIQGTRTTPYAIINNGYMKITGNSTPVEENNAFYGHMNKQVNLYAQDPANKTYVDIALSHVNAASKRYIVDLLKTLEKLNQQGFQVIINWQFDSEDDDVRELGEILESMFDLEFSFKAA
jgi:hypothetical protein